MTDNTQPDEGAPFDVTVEVTKRPADEVAAIKQRKEVTALALKQVNAVQLSFEKAADQIARLARKHKDVVYDVSTTAGMDDAKAARKEIRDVRYNIQNAEESAKAPLNTLKAAISSRAKELVAMIEPIEAPVDAQIKAEEKRKADEKAERERKAAEEKARIDQCIQVLRDSVFGAMGKSSTVIGNFIALTEVMEITLEEYGDRAGEAEQVKQQLLGKLGQMREAAAAQEAHAAELARQQEKLKKERAEATRQAIAHKEEEARLEAQRKGQAEQEARLLNQTQQLEKMRKAIDDEQANRQRQKEEDAAAVVLHEAAAERERLIDARAATVAVVASDFSAGFIVEPEPAGATSVYNDTSGPALAIVPSEYQKEIYGPTLYAAAKDVQAVVRAFLPQVTAVLPTSFGNAMWKLNAAITILENT